MLDRKTLIEDIASEAARRIIPQRAITRVWSEWFGPDSKDLFRFYYDSQVEWAESLSDEDLLAFANGYFHSFDVEDYMLNEEHVIAEKD